MREHILKELRDRREYLEDTNGCQRAESSTDNIYSMTKALSGASAFREFGVQPFDRRVCLSGRNTHFFKLIGNC